MVQEVFSLDKCFPMEDEIEIWDETIGDYRYEPVTVYLWLGSYKVTRAATPGNLFKIALIVDSKKIDFEITVGMKNFDTAVEFTKSLDRVEEINLDLNQGYAGFESKVGETIGIILSSSRYIDIFENNQHPIILTAEMRLEGALAYSYEDEEVTDEQKAEMLTQYQEYYPPVLSEGVTKDGVTQNTVASAIIDPMGTYFWLFTYTVREDAPADATGFILVPEQNLRDEPLMYIEVYIRGKGDVGGEGTIQSFDQLEAIWNELDSDILVNLDQTQWNFPHNAIRTQVQVGEVVGIGMHSKYDQEDLMPWPKVDESQLDYIWPTEDFAVALLNPEPVEPDQKFVWFYSAQVAEGTPVGTEINIDIMRGEEEENTVHFRVIIEIVAVLDTDYATILEAEQLQKTWDSIDSRQVIDLDNIEQGSTLRLTTGIGNSIGVLIKTKKQPVQIEKMIEKREFFGPIPWLDPEPRLESEEFYYYDGLLTKTTDVAKLVSYDKDFTAWFHSWTVDEFAYDQDMAHLYIFQNPKDDYTVKLEILVEQKEKLIYDLEDLMGVYNGLSARQAVDVLDPMWAEGWSQLNMTVTPGQTFGILLSVPDPETEIDLQTFDPDALLSMESFTPQPLTKSRSEFEFPDENGNILSLMENGSNQHLAASWIVEPGLTFGNINMDFTLKYRFANTTSGKEEMKWFNANFNVIVTEPKIESTTEFEELLASFNPVNLLEINVAEAINSPNPDSVIEYNLKMNEKVAIHLKSPNPDANVWFDYYETQPGLMVGGVEADGLQQTDGTYSFFREGQVADGATFGTAYFYFTLAYAVDQDGNALTEADIANFYGYDSLDEIGDIEEAFEELASYGAPCIDFWDHLLSVFDQNCEQTTTGSCIITNDENVASENNGENNLTKFYTAIMQHVMFNHPVLGLPDAEFMSEEEKTILFEENYPTTMLREIAIEFFKSVDMDQSGQLDLDEFKMVLEEPKGSECNDYGDWAGDTPCWDMFDYEIRPMWDSYAYEYTNTTVTDITEDDRQIDMETLFALMAALLQKYDPSLKGMTLSQMLEDNALAETVEFVASSYDYDSNQLISAEEFRDAWIDLHCDREGNFEDLGESEECMCFAESEETEYLCEDENMRYDLEFCVLENTGNCHWGPSQQCTMASKAMIKEEVEYYATDLLDTLEWVEWENLTMDDLTYMFEHVYSFVQVVDGIYDAYPIIDQLYAQGDVDTEYIELTSDTYDEMWEDFIGNYINTRYSGSEMNDYHFVEISAGNEEGELIWTIRNGGSWTLTFNQALGEIYSDDNPYGE